MAEYVTGSFLGQVNRSVRYGHKLASRMFEVDSVNDNNELTLCQLIKVEGKKDIEEWLVVSVNSRTALVTT